MVLLTTQLQIRAEDRQTFLTEMRRLVQASVAEPGCFRFGCYEDPWSPGSFAVFAEWRSPEALAAHERSAHVVAFKAAAGGTFVARSPAQVYTVSDVRPLGTFRDPNAGAEAAR